MRKRMKAVAESRAARWAFVWAGQACIFALAGIAAFLLRFDLGLPANNLVFLGYGIPVWILVKSLTFQFTGLNRNGFRYVSISDVSRLLIANLFGSAISCALLLAIAPVGFPRSIYLIDFIVAFLGTAGMRIAVRLIAEALHNAKGTGLEKAALIYGAGDAGVTLLREIRNNPKLAYRVVGFIDDADNKQDAQINGVPVMGRGDQIAALVARFGIETILVAIPSATGSEMSRILKLCQAAHTDFKTVPGLGEIVEGKELAGQIREVAVEDLLGRTPVRLEESQIRITLKGKVVLVTGAAGSIGSELCRQIARFHPAAIVGFEIAESPLFEIQREMAMLFPGVAFHAEIGSIQNRARLSEVMSHYRPNVVYHAAAYKHVPLMETHVFEAIENNVFGTYNVAQMAGQYGIEEFVLISSDKAVRPTNIMGATKRIAELIVLALQNGGTQYAAVRFGNVLGSSGSVIPIFKKQIAAGGPVTVTHPAMRRFFMTIPEACQLVLQASAIAEGGQICVLDMGQPVKIVDLAQNLILLSGLKPEEDIRIDFTGTRPGEKLYEELSCLLEDTLPTEHAKIRIFVGQGTIGADIQDWLDTLRDVCEKRNLGSLMIAIKELIPDYSPSPNLLKRLIGSQHPGLSSASFRIDS